MSHFPSTSTSSSPTSSENSETAGNSKKCQVCDQKAHGLHFGAITCRACAAFFRRVAAGASFPIKCRRGDGKCEIIQNGRSCCKKCRLKKCEKIGMDMQNFQFDRDPLSTSRKMAPLSLANYLGRPQFIIFCDPETASSSRAAPNFIDVSELVEKAAQILRKGSQTARRPGQNRLHKMAFSLNIDRSPSGTSLIDSFREIKKVGQKETMSFWEHDFLTTARWLTNFDEFQHLDLEVKLKLLKSLWHVWNRLEKLARTALTQKRANRNGGTTMVVMGQNCVLEMAKMELDISWITNYSVDQVAYYIEGVGDFSSFKLLDPIIELNPTDVELNYMLAQLAFQFAAKQLHDDDASVRIVEQLQEVIADDLHAYYVHEMGSPRYSDRMWKMLKINNMVQKSIREREEKMRIARTFDIFHVQFSEPDMFCGLY